MIGRILGGRYEILKAIDSGGMAYVFKAFCRKTNSYVAVKVLKEKLSTCAEHVRRFKKEAEAAFALEHENIVRVRDIGCDEGDYYMVMDYIEGSSLKSLIEQKGAIEEKEAVLIAIQICAALTAAHKRGIIHRDIKPQNILLDKEHNAKLTDFGIAKSINTTKQEIETQVIGSVYYISPEQARGDAMDARTDIYSLGILLYEMLTGELPHTGEQTVSVALKHINEQLTPPAQINTELSASISNIVLKATSKNRRDRYRSADAFKQDLMRALVDKSGDFVDTHTVQPKRAPIRPQDKRRQKTLKLIILSVLIGIFVTGAVFGVSLLISSDQSTLTVPDLTGQVLDDAANTLRRMGLMAEPVYDFSETVEEGRVISQTPEPGGRAMRGDTVVLTVSSGPAGLIMPDLYGYSIEEAQRIIVDMGLVLDEVIYELNETVPDGTVVSQMPAVDSIVSEGELVSLIVAGEAMPPGTAMPQLIGMPVQQALRQLNELGFSTCFVYEEEESTGSEGTVVKQSSMEGVQTPYETQIDLWISPFVDKPYRGTLFAQLEIPDADSRIRIVLEVLIEGVPVNFVVHETQVAEAGMHLLQRDISSFSGGTKTARVYVNNIEVHVSEVAFVGD